MVKLTGPLAEEAEEALQDLHRDIDVEKHIATATHNIVDKLISFDYVTAHIAEKHNPDSQAFEFFMDISDELVELREAIRDLEKGHLHVLLEEEAADKMNRKWRIGHLQTIKDYMHRAHEVDTELLHRVHQFLRNMKVKCSEAGILDGESEHILENIMKFFATYEKFLMNELALLDKS